MSNVPYTINLDDYICNELERMRTMTKTFDFGGLPGAVERIQYHASRMESALYKQKETIRRIGYALNASKPAEEIIKDIVKLQKEFDESWVYTHDIDEKHVETGNVLGVSGGVAVASRNTGEPFVSGKSVDAVWVDEAVKVEYYS